MSLKTSGPLHTYQFQELPIVDTVIDRVEEMSTEDKATEMINGYPNFEWIPVNPITDDYKNKYDDKSEYEHSEGVQEKISLEDELEIHEPL